MKNVSTLIIFLLVLPALGAGCSSRPAYEKPVTPVRVEAVQEHSEAGGLRYSATIQPFAQVEVVPRVPGYIEEILQVPDGGGRTRPVQAGDSVSVGTVLARIRGADYQVKIDQAKSQLMALQAGMDAAKTQITEAEVAVSNAQLDFDRASKLFASQSITKPEYDGAKAKLDASLARLDGAKSQLRVAQARVDGASAQLDEAGLALRDTVIRVPFDGVVLRRAVELGSLAGPPNSAFSIADTNSVRAVFGVPESIVPTLRVGEAMKVTTEAIPGKEFSGRISEISPVADPRNRVFEVKTTITDAGKRLRVGMIATLELPGGNTEPVAVLPVASIVRTPETGNDYAVFVLQSQEDKYFARFRKVRLGEAFGNMIAVADGVRVGEQVIVTGTTLVTDGQEVRLLQ